jgi:heparosan-N-sulfate-glucuronate 5-epimerase
MKLILLSLLTIIHQCIFTQKINEYSTFSKHVNIETYLGYNNRTFDPNGIILEKGVYHPLTISFYGIMACESYKKNKDSLSFKRLNSQFQYFLDTSKVHIRNNNTEMGLPYKFAFHDLKAPWYSGMTQGAAISFMLRYYDITKDIRAKNIAKQLCIFMLKETNKGGTIGSTPEKFLTIEEYPKSKSNSHVFNGFIIGLIGLYEYLQFFPEDTEAKKIHDKCYEGLFASLEHLDTPSWTNYNRNNKAISNFYIRFQLNEFEHLYEIYKDQRFLDQMMIWGMMAYNKFDTQIKFHKYPNFQYSIATKDSLMNAVNVKVPSLKINEGLLVPNNLEKDTVFISKKENAEIKSTTGFNYIEFKTGKPVKLSKIQIDDVPILKTNIALSDSNLVKIQFNDTLLHSATIHYKSSKKKGIPTHSIQTKLKSEYDNPFFAHQLEGPFSVIKDKVYTISFESVNTPDLIILYRFTEKQDKLSTVKWIHYNKINNLKYQSEKDGFIQLMFCYRLNYKFSSLNFVKLNE